MDTPLRRNLLLIAAIGAASAAAISLIRLIVPDAAAALAALPPGLLGGLAGSVAELLVGFAGALAVLAVALLVRASATRTPSVRGVRAVRVGALLAAAAVAVATPGGMIPVAGYCFALAVQVGVVVLAVLLVVRRPAIGLVVVVAVVGAGVWAVLALDGVTLIGRILVAFAPLAPVAGVALAHLGAAAALLAWVLLGGRSGSRQGGLGDWVLRHRVAITVLAALCSVPYAFARATWLTPWPLFAPSAEMFDAEPGARLTGLILGLGMLAGGVLTLGLVRPWGERFPRWMAGRSRGEVPIALAVLPASLISVLFTVGGIDLVVVTAGTPDVVAGTLEMALVLPFWLWGPLLALATWGYVLHRQGRGAEKSLPVETQSRVH